MAAPEVISPSTMVGQYNATPPVFVDTKPSIVQTDINGNVKTVPAGGSGPQPPASSISVIEAGLQYETVAAGQTAQVLGSTGAIGDYLSHVVFQPTALGAGTSTIIDNATVAFTYTAGTLSDLRPITVVMNAFSVSGPWKITTGANMTATAFGKWT